MAWRVEEENGCITADTRSSSIHRRERLDGMLNYDYRKTAHEPAMGSAVEFLTGTMQVPAKHANLRE